MDDVLETTVLSPREWMSQARAHQVRAVAFTEDHLKRRQAQIKHPVYDFLFEYYPVRPSTLRTWHPGLGVRIPADAPHAGWRDYTLIDDSLVTVDLKSFMSRRGAAVRYIHDLLRSVSANPAHFDCFGLHEWAMVYQAGPGEIRHDLPLRLGHAATDAVVEAHQLKCTHFDAFRFFTPPAVPLNLTVLTREEQPINDQCGCLHATMDLYKWAAKLGPLIPGEVLLDAFELARDTRVLDMEASPYDCRGHGFAVVAIETPEGKAEYVTRQRALAARAKPIRDRLVSLTGQALTATLSQ